MRKLSYGLAAAALVASTACGGDKSTAPAVTRNNPGTGTSTMRVMADIEGSDDAGAFSTEYLVTLRDGLANRISGATVTVSNQSLGTLTLTETGVSTGDYFSLRSGFPLGDFRLDVTRGTDNIRGVILGGPGVQRIIAPVNGSVATAGQPLNVTWSIPSRAKSAEVETNDFGPVQIADLGAYTIAGANNPANASQRLRVRRFNEVDIAGGLPGSRLRVTVRNTVEPISVR